MAALWCLQTSRVRGIPLVIVDRNVSFYFLPLGGFVSHKFKVRSLRGVHVFFFYKRGHL